LKGNRPYLPPSPNWGDATKQTMTPTVGASGSPTTNDPTPAAAAAPAATTTPAAAAAPAAAPAATAQTPRRSESAVKAFGTADQINKDRQRANEVKDLQWRSWFDPKGVEAQKKITETQRYETTKDEDGRTTGVVHPTTAVQYSQQRARNANLARETSRTAYDQYLANSASMGPARAAIFARTEHPGAFEHIKKTFQNPATGEWTFPGASSKWMPGQPFDTSGPEARTMAEGIESPPVSTPAAAPGPTPVAAPAAPPAPAPVTPVTPPATQPAPIGTPAPVDPSLS